MKSSLSQADGGIVLVKSLTAIDVCTFQQCAKLAVSYLLSYNRWLVSTIGLEVWIMCPAWMAVRCFMSRNCNWCDDYGAVRIFVSQELVNTCICVCVGVCVSVCICCLGLLICAAVGFVLLFKIFTRNTIVYYGWVDLTESLLSSSTLPVNAFLCLLVCTCLRK